MKKGIVIFFAVVFMLLATTACGRSSAGEVTASSAITSSENALEPVSSLQEIEAAKTPEELRTLIETYQSSGDLNSAYLAAKKLIELDPSDTRAYQDAIDALLSTISSDYQEIENLVKLSIQNAPEGADDLVRWVTAQNQTFSFNIPFVGDYVSESEINTVGTTPGNITNQAVLSELWQNGLLTTQGDWVYFMLPTEDYYVYKMRLDGTGLTKVGDARGDNLNVVGDWLYYKNLSDAGMPYRIRTDGTQKEGPLFNKAVMMSVTKDWICYSDRALYKIKTDGSETVSLLNDPCETMALYDEWIYYCTGGNNSEFCRVSIEGGEPQKLVDGWMYHYSTVDGWIYYLVNHDDKAIWRMRTDGSEQSEVYRNDYMLTAFGIANDKLAVSACTEKDERGKPYPTELIVIDLATNTVQQTLKQYVPTIYVAGDSIYYYGENEVWHSLNLSTGAESAIAAPTVNESAVIEETAEQPAPSVNGNTAANLFMSLEKAGSGMVARDGDTIYFGNPNDGNQLYSATQNGDSTLQKMLNTSVAYINVADKIIYYCDTKDNNSICSIGVDGQNQKKLAKGRCDDLSYADGWLYYRTSYGILKLPAGGGEPIELVSGKMKCVYAFSNWLYYIEDHEAGGLWRIPVDGGDPQRLYTDSPAKYYAIQDNRIYCMIDAGNSVDVLRMNLDGSEQTVAFSAQEKLDAINISGNRLLILKNATAGANKMILVWNLDKNAAESTIDDLSLSCAFCFGSDVYYFTVGGLVRQNLNSSERVSIGH
jgi:hypothetical protein